MARYLPEVSSFSLINVFRLFLNIYPFVGIDEESESEEESEEEKQNDEEAKEEEEEEEGKKTPVQMEKKKKKGKKKFLKSHNTYCWMEYFKICEQCVCMSSQIYVLVLHRQQWRIRQLRWQWHRRRDGLCSVHGG